MVPSAASVCSSTSGVERSGQIHGRFERGIDHQRRDLLRRARKAMFGGEVHGSSVGREHGEERRR